MTGQTKVRKVAQKWELKEDIGKKLNIKPIYRVFLLMNWPRIRPQLAMKELVETGILGHIGLEQFGQIQFVGFDEMLDLSD